MDTNLAMIRQPVACSNWCAISSSAGRIGPAVIICPGAAGIGVKVAVGPTLADAVEEALQLLDDDIGFGRGREVSAVGAHHDVGFRCKCRKERLLGSGRKALAHAAAKHEHRAA